MCRCRGQGAFCVEARPTQPRKSLCKESWGTRHQGAQLELWLHLYAQGQGLHLYAWYIQGSQLAMTWGQKGSFW